jgi:hypothetical protein
MRAVFLTIELSVTASDLTEKCLAAEQHQITSNLFIVLSDILVSVLVYIFHVLVIPPVDNFNKCFVKLTLKRLPYVKHSLQNALQVKHLRQRQTSNIEMLTMLQLSWFLSRENLHAHNRDSKRGISKINFEEKN